MHICMHTYIHTHTPVHTYIHTHIHTYTYVYIHTYIHTYIHACMHAYLIVIMWIYRHSGGYAIFIDKPPRMWSDVCSVASIKGSCLSHVNRFPRKLISPAYNDRRPTNMRPGIPEASRRRPFDNQPDQIVSVERPWTVSPTGQLSFHHHTRIT